MEQKESVLSNLTSCSDLWPSTSKNRLCNFILETILCPKVYLYTVAALHREQPTTSTWSLWATASGLGRGGGAKVRQENLTQRVVRSLPHLACVWFLLCWLSNIGAFAWPSECSPNDQLEFAYHEPVSEPTVQSTLSTFAPFWGVVWANLIAAVLCLQEGFELWTCGLSFLLGLIGSAFTRVLICSGVHTPSKKVWQARFVGKRRYRHRFRKKQKGIILKSQPKYACLYLKIPATRFCSRPNPVHTSLPRTGLNHMFRGGANGSAVTARRRTETNEQALLTGLQSLLLQFGSSSEQPSKGKGKGKTKSSESVPETIPEDPESGLVDALNRIIQRSKKKPGTLLQRLTSLVNSASSGQVFAKKAKPMKTNKEGSKKGSSPEGGEPQPKRHKSENTIVAGPQAKNASPAVSDRDKGKGKGKQRTNSPAQPRSETRTPKTWADIAARPPKPMTSNVPSKDLQPKQPVVLLRDAFKQGDIRGIDEVKSALEDGKCPEGVIAICPSIKVFEDCIRLAEVQQISDENKFALAIQCSEGQQGPEGCSTMPLPTWEHGHPHVRRFWVKPLRTTLPPLPIQQIRTSKVAVTNASLIAFRATIVKHLVSRDVWDAYKRNPQAMIAKAFPAPTLHSSYGWQEKKVEVRKGQDDVILQGFLRTTTEHQHKILSHIGDDGLFIDHLASSGAPKQFVRWMPVEDNEEAKVYLSRVAVAAKQVHATIAHRRGGGNFLGVRLPPGKFEPVSKTWCLTGAPKVWSSQDVTQCLLETCCTTVAILRPPSKGRGWLVKATVKEENDLGVVALQAGNFQLMLTRAQPRITRTTEVLSSIRPKSQRREELELLKPKHSSQAGDNKSSDRDNSRSPRRDSSNHAGTVHNGSTASRQLVISPKSPLLHQDKYEALECGARGNCGYLCLAMALGLEKGEDAEKIRPVLAARSRTIRHDLHVHMNKHKQDYLEYFSPGLFGTAEQEGGEVPHDWGSWLAGTLKDGRWIDGLSLLAASKRYGICISVIPCSGDPKDAPMRFGQPRSGKAPIFLLLKNGHYQLARLKVGKAWPQEWLQAEEARIESSMLRAGGKSDAKSVVSTPHRWRGSHTPCKSRASWKPSATPNSNIRQSSTCTKVRKSGGKVSSSSWRPKVTPTKTNQGARDPSIVDACKSLDKASMPSSGSQKQQGSEQGVPEKFVWVCNLCQQVFRYANKRTLMDARNRHIHKEHRAQRAKVATCFNRHQKHPTAEATDQIPTAQRAWSCPKCGKGLAYMGQWALKKSRDAHVMQCYKLTRKKLRKLHYKSPIWKNHHAQLVKDNAAAARRSTDQALETYNSETKSKAFRIPAEFQIGNGLSRFSCGICTVLFQNFKGRTGLQSHQCQGATGRRKILASPSRKRTWLCCRTYKDPGALKFFIRKWRITKSELDILDKRLCGHKDVPPLSQCQWIRDLCADGDIEPNPGPSDSNSHNNHSSLTGYMANVAGSANAWSFARWIAAEKPAIAAIQEHCMLPDKCSDLAQFMLRKGYRSWFVAPPAARNVLGQSYTTGGVAVFIRKDKNARLIKQHVANDGQALMIQLDHAFVIAAYLPPRGSAHDTLSTLDDWIISLSANEPVILCGDFNQEPHLAQRWNDLSGRGAHRSVVGDDGSSLPTRWDGRRCIDWLWTTHPPMLPPIVFSDVVFADHKVIKFQLRYCQTFVQAFQPVPTRNLAKPCDIDTDAWVEAINQAWQNFPTPSEASTQDEWVAFCDLVEKAYDQACSLCQIAVSRHSKLVRNKGSSMQVRPLEPTTFRLKQVVSCRELKARKLLGRAREANLQFNRGVHVSPALLHKIWNHPLVRSQSFNSLLEIEAWAEAEVKSVVSEQRQANLQQWRQDMRNDQSKARQWLKKQNTLPVTSVYEASYDGGGASKSNQEALKTIRAFWQTIWHRNGPSPNDAFQSWCLHTPRAQALPWKKLSAQEMYTQAKKQRGSAAGPDGFSGTEVSELPLRAWEILEILLDRWISRGELPSVWQSVRQVHLQKPDAKLRPDDGAIAAQDMRPISIQCCIWRVIASSWASRASTRAWIASWVHPTACGGLRNKSVAKAVDSLFQKFEKSGILLSLDFKKCFDTVHPTFGIACLRHLGCPAPMLTMLEIIWQQFRWLTYNGECQPTPVSVNTSMPQGDAISPLTLLAVMTGVTRSVLAQEVVSFPLVTYLDDRNMIAETPEQTFRLWCTWQHVSQSAGLWENDSKVRVVARKAAHKSQLLQIGFKEHHVVNAARVLGIDFNAKLGAACKNTQAERLKDASRRLDRIGLLPVSLTLKAAHATSMVVPKACWGSWTSLVPVRRFISIVKRIAGTSHLQASTHLFYLLAGHGLHVEFCAAFQAYSFLATEVRQSARPWPRRSVKGTWLGTVRAWLASLGWNETGDFQWHHDTVGAAIHWRQPLPKNLMEKEQHAIRESWRRLQFNQFLNSSRRDSQAVGNPAYDEARITHVRKAFRTADVHGRAVMVGAIVSDARFDRMNRRDIQSCRWCQQNCVPCWEHVSWVCPGFADTRPNTPRDALQRVLGWPSGHATFDAAVLAHLSSVRSRLLDMRYRGIFH